MSEQVRRKYDLETVRAIATWLRVLASKHRIRAAESAGPFADRLWLEAMLLEGQADAVMRGDWLANTEGDESEDGNDIPSKCPDVRRTIWDLAEKAQAEVDQWPEGKRRAADEALVTPKKDRGG